MKAATFISTEVETRPIGALVEEYGGMSAVARQSGLSVPHLWMIVNGRRNPVYATRHKLANVFGSRVDTVHYPADVS